MRQVKDIVVSLMLFMVKPNLYFCMMIQPSFQLHLNYNLFHPVWCYSVSFYLYPQCTPVPLLLQLLSRSRVSVMLISTF